MEEKGFKKLLIDLGLSLRELADEVGVSQWAITLYFRGTLRSDVTRRRIKRALQRHARAEGIQLPKFWEDVAA